MTWIIFFFVCESHLTDFPQAAAWAKAEPEPAEAYEHGLGFSFRRPRPRKAKLYRRLSGQAKPAQHYRRYVFFCILSFLKKLYQLVFDKLRPPLVLDGGYMGRVFTGMGPGPYLGTHAKPVTREYLWPIYMAGIREWWHSLWLTIQYASHYILLFTHKKNDVVG